MKNEVSYDYFLLGAKIATCSDEEQAEFFKGFANELNSWETHSHKEMQMIMINKKLSTKVKEVLERYLPAIWFKGE